MQRERIGPTGMLDPHDPRAEVGEHAPDERRRPRGAEHDDGGVREPRSVDVGDAVGDRGALAPHRDRRQLPRGRFGVDRVGATAREVGRSARPTPGPARRARPPCR